MSRSKGNKKPGNDSSFINNIRKFGESIAPYYYVAWFGNIVFATLMLVVLFIFFERKTFVFDLFIPENFDALSGLVDVMVSFIKKYALHIIFVLLLFIMLFYLKRTHRMRRATRILCEIHREYTKMQGAVLEPKKRHFLGQSAIDGEAIEDDEYLRMLDSIASFTEIFVNDVEKLFSEYTNVRCHSNLKLFDKKTNCICTYVRSSSSRIDERGDIDEYREEFSYKEDGAFSAIIDDENCDVFWSN